ncbi:MAG: 4Fe-4S binding protein [Deferribacteraceae bacterium]|jgi:2-oxoglutarate ferredoxin oxidoreductase subunit delta|nr:4Fe-4S binding protein [Deferribacteraceae bacterium]
MKRSGIVTIKCEWCKGCGVCAHFCPADVLEMHEFKVRAKSPEKCTACMMCEMRCPDFAITVEVVERADEQK